MLDSVVSRSLDLLAFVFPVSLGVTNIVFFPLAALWLFGARWTFPKWPPVFGWPEKLFLVYLGISLASAFAGMDPVHSLREIKNKDLYMIIVVVVVALARDREKHKRLLNLFMISGVLMAVWGLIQFSVGVNQTDKHEGVFLALPGAIAGWPRPLLDLLSMLNGRVMGTRGHPLAYAECLLFNWAFAICFFLGARGRASVRCGAVLALLGISLLLSQSRGPWIAAALLLGLGMIMVPSKRSGLLAGMGIVLVGLMMTVPSLRHRVMSITDASHHSNKERLHMWQAGLALWKTHPLLGVGPGSVKKLSVTFQTPEERVWGPWGHLHSIYVNGLAERGALGLLSFFLFMGALFREVWKGWRSSSADPWRSAVLGGSLLGMVGFWVGGLTESSYNTAVVIMMFYFVSGLALALVRHEQTPSA